MGTVILIRPNFTRTLQPNPPIGLGYLASFLEKNNHKVILIDCRIRNISNETLLNLIKKYRPQVVGITALTAYYEEMRKLCNFIYKKREENDKQLNFLLIIGGIHATALPELSLLECKADLAVLGEGELTLLELIETINKNKSPFEIDGIAYLENGKIKFNKPRELIDDLDKIPFPAWHLMPPNTYPLDPHGHGFKRIPFAPIFTTRGCPFACTYCASTNFWRRRIRFRSPKNVVEEMEFLMKNFGVREFHIWDDNFTISKEHAIEICREIIRRNMDITLKCPNGLRIDSLDEEILTWMKKAGFYQIVLAVESASQRILNNVNKKLSLSKIPRVAKLASKIGLITKGFFILGLPGETINSALITLNYSKKIGLNFVSFFIAQPLPGSELFDQWTYGKQISHINWDDIQFNVGVYSLGYLSIEILTKLRNRGYLIFFFRLKILFTLLKFPKVTINWSKNVLQQIFRRFFERRIKRIWD